MDPTTPRALPSRPTTPLRPTSRTSLRSSTAYDPTSSNPYNNTSNRRHATPLSALEPAFAELADGIADLEANFMHLQLMHESLSRFSENFAAFLYGLNMNAFCVDFPEAPVAESWKRAKINEEMGGGGGGGGKEGPNGGGKSPGRGGVGAMEEDLTIVSTATSFVDHPSTVRSASRTTASAGARGTQAQGRGRGSGIARGAGTRGRGVGRTRPSGIARGTRGREVR